MPVSFNQIPENLRVPLVYIEFDNSRAVKGTPAVEYKMLVLGQMLPSGSAEEATPVRVLSADHAIDLFGRGSMLAAMFTATKKADRFMETWCIPLKDDAAGVAATGTIDFTGAATGTGVLNCYIAGRKVRASVPALATSAEAATALVDAINADLDLPVTATVATGTVTLTARNKGECGNDIDIRFNYYTGEVYPAGLSVAVTAMTNGAANPDITDAIAGFGDEWWNGIVSPWTDGSNMVALEAELLDRWGPTNMKDGIAYTAIRGTHSESATWGDARNGHLGTTMPTGASPTPPWIWAAVYGVVASGSLSIDPARPLQTLVLPGIMPPTQGERWTMEERNLLLYDGLSTFTVDSGGLVRIERAITTYQKNAYGLPDPSYLDVTTPATLSYIRYATRARITQKFPRHKLADDGTRLGPGQAIVTPSIIRAELLALFRELETKGLVENFDQYKKGLLVERDADDRNRVNVLSPPDLINQLRIFAEQIQFIL
ncbi:phage tail protein [Pseudodesulfovibrio sp. JC047]|uniref:phage tail sheath subtilisin-like domain-containing protein n=1 Tax=Pseudodesulfovibrio sp. JC047 TaxID=2683199 RepID=UPI0013D18CDF|nr:phage tail sheath subtilisin-like domain-containing protein [Pseudodesulfovibrio sp. JC047]NDV20881.1 phage tail protein [Pseudodesulfovibrio sp. JC047]